MPRRALTLPLNATLVLTGALLGIATNYATSQAGRLPLAFRLLQRWSLALVGIMILLLLVGHVWLWLLEQPRPVRPTWNTKRSPYPGLEAFTEQDAAVFFGREPEIMELLDRLHPALPEQAHRFVSMVGPSGVGKSSLVHAGLLPHLTQRRIPWAVVPTLVPEDHPIRNLTDSLNAALSSASARRSTPRRAGELGAILEDLRALRAARGGRSARVLLVIDQAEELMTLTGPEERGAFLNLLRGALRADPNLWVVAVLRSEFLTPFLTAGFADLFHQPVLVGPLGRAALFSVIEEPAERAGLTFAPGVVNLMVDDTGSGEALPLLAYTLETLYPLGKSGGTISVADYDRLDGVAGALARQANKVTGELEDAVPSAPVLPTLLKFVAWDQTEPTRRRVRRSDLTDAQQSVVDAFVAARLLTSDAAGQDAVLQVAHEALFANWPPLRQAVQAHADDLRRRAELERWALDWAEAGRPDDYLVRDKRLRTAQEWAASQADALSELPLVREFLDCSTRADRAVLERLSNTVAGRALSELREDPELSLRLALAAIDECAPTPLAHRALLAALVKTRVRGVLRGHQDSVLGVAYSPDGRRLATASGDRTARIWDARLGSELLVLQGHTDRAWGVAWSPDGRWLATASADRTARVWDADDAAEALVLHGHSDTVLGVAWSPDGRRLATVSYDRTARIWDIGHRSEPLVLFGHEDEVLGVAWSPDGQRLATTSRDCTTRIWHAEDGTQIAFAAVHDEFSESLAWSPDGRRLATACYDRTARVWDADLTLETLVARARTRVLRQLTDDERRAAMLPEFSDRDGEAVTVPSSPGATRPARADVRTA